MNFRFFLSLALCAMFFVACDKNESAQNTEILEEVADPALATTNEISDETTEFLNSLDFKIEDAVLGTMQYPDGSTEEVYTVDDDITIHKEQYAELLAQTGQAALRQYRTYNLVNNNQTITVIGYTGNNSSGLTSNMRTGLRWAIDNYNALNMGLSFSLSYGTNYGNKDIVVYRVANGQQGGRAGFPSSSGNPYKWVRIYSGLDNADNNTNEHVIGHEIGHCLGLRHTDWNTRASCGQSGEARNPDGAVHIPGTPTGYDSNSLMLACFGQNEDGEFGFYDRVALEYLY